jgi:hypothetical protein
LITLWMGIYPSSFSSFFDASVAAMVQHHTAALESSHKVAAAQSALSWSGLTRPTTTSPVAVVQDVDGRAKPGHDGGNAGPAEGVHL